MIKQLLTLLSFSLLFTACSSKDSSPIESIETPYTITNVRQAKIDNNEMIIASAYDGQLLCYDNSGKLKWENKLSGFLNYDVFCADIDSDGSDEILTANTDGSIYAIDDDGKDLWSFRPNDAIMTSVCVFHKDGKPYIAAGGYDTNFYYLSTKGELISTISSTSYSNMGEEKGSKAGEKRVVNFLKPVSLADGSEIVAMSSVVHSHAGKGEMFFFKPLETTPYKNVKFKNDGRPIGSFTVNYNDKNSPEIVLGTSWMIFSAEITRVDVNTGDDRGTDMLKLVKDRAERWGYRIIHTMAVNKSNDFEYLTLMGSRILLSQKDINYETTDVLAAKYSYNDVVYDGENNKLILASTQSGGNCIHIVDLNNKDWKEAYQNYQPKGNITSILDSGKEIMSQIEKFEKPEWESSPRPTIYLMSDTAKVGTYVGDIAKEIHSKYPSPKFMNGADAGQNIGQSEDPKLWHRDTMSNVFYRNKRGAAQYNNTQQEILDHVRPYFDGDSKGVTMWGGHGNDPYYYSLSTYKKLLDLTTDDKQLVFIYPELEAHDKNFEWMLNDLIFPMADYAQKKNGRLYIRTKYIFWNSIIYRPLWSKLASGQYHDVFVPSMEETSCKTQELSFSGRMGIWCSGAVDSWGARGVRDNAAYNRIRQTSHQMLPNHFLRMLIYHVSSGAQYLDNYPVDQHYMNILWQLIAKGVVYVPTRDQIVSINPVRMNMIDPTDRLLECNSIKDITKYDLENHNNDMVFTRLGGSFPAAPTCDWDFSKYAAGVGDHRLHYLAPYSNGLVLLTQPDDPASKYRKPLEDNINHIYKGKMKEFFTDGEKYYSDVKKTESYNPKTYYKEVESAIKEGAKMLPLTVKGLNGDVAWVTAQSAPTHLRLTILDGGYINPSQKEAQIKIGTAKVKKITNILTGETIKVNNNIANITIDCGMFVFLDVELSEEL